METAMNVLAALGYADRPLIIRPFFIFAFFKEKIYRNIFLALGFTVLYPYRPAGGRQGAYRQAGRR